MEQKRKLQRLNIMKRDLIEKINIRVKNQDWEMVAFYADKLVDIERQIENLKSEIKQVQKYISL